jgi:cytochrome c5
MSNLNQPQPEEQIEDHATLIKTPKQLIVTIVLSFVLPVVVILLLVSWVTSGIKPSAGSDSLGAEATALRIAPVARIELIDASAPKVLQTGEQVYNAACAGCHNAGVAGAYKFADKTAWAPVIATGLDSMINNVIKGKGVMPARGGNPTLDDLEIARAVVYMTNAAGASFAEPAAVAVAPAPAPAPAPMVVAAAAPPPAAAAPAAVVAAAPAAASINLAAGEALYKQACAACHSIGIAGAPKFGDKAGWAKATSTGMESMIASVIKGKGVMPARGGAANASDADLAAAVHYMVNALQ